MHGLAKVLLLGAGLGTAHFGFDPEDVGEKPAAQPFSKLHAFVDSLPDNNGGPSRPNRSKAASASQADINSTSPIPGPAAAPFIDRPTLPHSVTRRDLVRALQRGLARAGCYSGPIAGEWDRTTKRAMSAFLSAVNASLPLNKPDAILLALVQGDTRPACMKSASSAPALRSPLANIHSRSALPDPLGIGGPVSASTVSGAQPTRLPSRWRPSGSRQTRGGLVSRRLSTSPGRRRSIRELFRHPLSSSQE
jgi:hypothetical protein